MKKVMTVLAFVFALGMAQTASAVDVRGMNCDLEGEISGLSISIFFGGQVLAGDGEIRCTSPEFDGVVVQPVELRLISGGIGFDVTYVKSIDIVAIGVDVANDPSILTGSFNIGATAGATLFDKGLDIDAALKLTKKNGFGFEIGLKGKEAVGLGVRLHGMVFTITPVN